MYYGALLLCIGVIIFCVTGGVMYIGHEEIIMPLQYPYPDCERIELNFSYLSVIPKTEFDAMRNLKDDIETFGINETMFEVTVWMMGYNDRNNITMKYHEIGNNRNYDLICWDDDGITMISYIVDGGDMFDTIVVSVEGSGFGMLIWTNHKL